MNAGITEISTTADLFGHAERIMQLHKLDAVIDTEYCRITSSAGTHLYRRVNGAWLSVVK